MWKTCWILKTHLHWWKKMLKVHSSSVQPVLWTGLLMDFLKHEVCKLGKVLVFFGKNVHLLSQTFPKRFDWSRSYYVDRGTICFWCSMEVKIFFIIDFILTKNFYLDFANWRCFYWLADIWHLFRWSGDCLNRSIPKFLEFRTGFLGFWYQNIEKIE